MPRFKEAFIGYHYVIASFVVAAYAAIEYLLSGQQLLGRLDEETRGTLYLSLAGTNGVLLGFGITGITIFTSLGSGRGMDFLRGTPGFAYTRTVFMGAIWAFAFGTVMMTVMIVADSARHPREWLELLAAAALALVVLRTWALLWLLNKLLDQVLKDAAERHARKVERLQH